MHTCKSCDKKFKGFQGNVNSYCSRECYALFLKGRKLSEDTKRKIGETFKKILHLSGGSWWASGMKGKKWSDQHRQNIQKTILERTPEKRKKIGEKLSRAFIGRTVSEETKNKIRAARMNQKTSNKTSKTELCLREALTKASIPFETYRYVGYRTIPDLFIAPNICIYVDGCFWHKCPEHFDKVARVQLGSRISNSINASTGKDQRINQSLTSAGYIVLRIWEHDIKNNLSGCVVRINSTRTVGR